MESLERYFRGRYWLGGAHWSALERTLHLTKNLGAWVVLALQKRNVYAHPHPPRLSFGPRPLQILEHPVHAASTLHPRLHYERAREAGNGTPWSEPYNPACQFAPFLERHRAGAWSHSKEQTEYLHAPSIGTPADTQSTSVCTVHTSNGCR